MEDDDDAQSSPLPHSVPVTAALQAQSHVNGKIAVKTQPVTIAAPPQHTLTLALPIQQPRLMGSGGGGGGGGGREDCWSDGATSTLIDAWGERYLELSRGNLKQKHWQDVADIVSARDDYTKNPKTDIQCKNRIDTLKKKYKMEKSKISSDNESGRWPFFNRLDHLIGPNNPDTKPSPQHLPPARPHRHARAAPNHDSSKKPLAVGIPVGIRSSSHRFQHRYPQKRNRSPSVSSSPPISPVSSDSFPPDIGNGKKRRRGGDDPPPPPMGNQKRRVEGLKELTRAILKFGEVYERVESSKLQQVMEMEKQRMGFAKELELQRMQFFMKTQMELTQLKHHGRIGCANSSSQNSG